MTGPRSITQVENAVLGPLEGWLMDRLGPRAMVAMGVSIMSLGLILFGMMRSLWMFFVAEIIIVLGTGMQGLLVLSVAINHWFRRRRTFAQSVMLLGYATAGIVGIPLLVYIQSTLGWRSASIGTGILVLVMGLPLSMLLRRSPEPYGLLPDGDVPEEEYEHTGNKQRYTREYDFTLKQAIRTRSFWFLGLGQAIGGMGMAAVQIHLFLHLEEGVGLETTTAAFVWTVASMSNIPSRLIGGILGDRLPKNVILGSTMVMMSVAVFVLGMARSLPMAMAFAVIYGIAWGMRTPVMNAIQGDFFGRKSQGTIRGWLNSITLPLRLTGPLLVAYVADIQGTYSTIFTIFAFVTLFGSALIFLATPPKPPVQDETLLY